jgi:hypothetical protein
MAFPTSTDLLTMDYSQNGMPFVNIPASGNIDTFTMDYSQNGLPFVTNPSVSGPSNIGGWDGVTAANIQTLMGVQYANIETIYNVT